MSTSTTAVRRPADAVLRISEEAALAAAVVDDESEASTAASDPAQR